ncbi:MAG: hypothetical protein Q9213_002670 [Squamulea squamosa]
MRASYKCRTSLTSESSTPSTTRLLSQTTSLAYPRKGTQDKDSLSPEATEYSKSGTDDASARQEDTAFDPDTTDPSAQKDKVGDKTGASDNPLEVSPANHDISQPRDHQEGGSENSSASSGTTSGRERSSGGSSPKKGRQPPKLQDLIEVVDCVQRLLGTASVDGCSSNIAFLERLIRDQNCIGILCNSSLFEWATEARQTRSRSVGAQFQHQSDVDQPADNTISADDSNSDVGSCEPFSANGSERDWEVSRRGSGAVRKAIHVPHETRLQGQIHRLSAKLHCLYGVPIQCLRIPEPSPASDQGGSCFNAEVIMHPFARSRVYDLRQHSEGTLWGPFVNDGSQSADWEKIEAIMIILYYNVHVFTDKYGTLCSNLVPPWDRPFVGVTPNSLKLHPSQSSIERPPSLPVDLQDPYNVSGTWMRVVCFLDYRELFTFNFSEDQPLPGQPRPPIGTEEAIRFIIVKLQVTKIEKPGENDGQGLPVVHFKGSSNSALPPVDYNANSKIRGTVRLTPEGEVRWTTFSVFHGEERWRSEGIQLGGVRAARGILGYWFDKDFDEYGPAGPTAFWKAPDALAQAKRALRSLFGRKKRQQQEQQEQAQQQKPTQTSNDTPTITTTAPLAAASTPNDAQAPKTERNPSPAAPAPGATPTLPSQSGAPPSASQTPAPTTTTTDNSKPLNQTATTGTTGHHIPASTQLSEAKSINLNPTAPASNPAATTTSEAPNPTATAPPQMSGGAGNGAAQKVNEGGMSATSGPLTDDPMAQGYTDEGVGGKEKGVVTA